MIRGGHILYQDIADPIVPEQEVVTIDKYFKDHTPPLFRKKFLPIAILAGSFFMHSEPIAAAEDLTIDKWGQPIQQPYFAKKRFYHTGESRFETPRTIYIDDWQQRLSEPVRAKPRDANGLSVIHDRPIVPFEWDRLQNQPYFSKRRHVPSGESRFEVPRNILITDWFQPASLPTKIKQRQILGGDVRTEVVSDEVVTLDKWYRPLSEPYFPKRRFIPSGETRFEVPRDILITDWLSSYPNQLKQKIRDSKTGEFRFEVPRTILVTDWFQEIRQPYFSKRRHVPSGETRFEVPRTILITDWFQPVALPNKLKARREQGLYVRIDPIADDTHINEWYQPASEPYFKKRRNYFTGEFRFEVPRTILITDWWQPISQPRIIKSRNYHTGEARFEVPRQILLSDWWQPTSQPRIIKLRDSKTGAVLVEFSNPAVELITVDKWFKEVIQPRIIKKRNYFTGEYRFEVPRAILVTDWLNQLSQPRITKKRQNQTAVSFLPFEIITVDKWFREAGQPYVKRKRQEGFYTTVNNIIVPFDWNKEVVQPIRNKINRLNIPVETKTPLSDVILDWYQTQPEQVRKQVDRIFNGEVRVDVFDAQPEEITIDKWFQPTQQPLNRRDYSVIRIQSSVMPPDEGLIVIIRNPLCLYSPISVVLKLGSEITTELDFNSEIKDVVNLNSKIELVLELNSEIVLTLNLNSPIHESCI